MRLGFLVYCSLFLRVIPALEFPEAGLIHNITVGGVWDYSHTELPEIQVWTATGQGSWRKSASVSSNTDITPNIALNVHRYTPFTPLDVRAGDILGYYQPSDGRSLFQIYHIPGGPDNYLRRSSSPLDTVSQQENTEDALPLITVGFTPTGSGEHHTISGNCLYLECLNKDSGNTDCTATSELFIYCVMWLNKVHYINPHTLNIHYRGCNIQVPQFH